MLIPEVLKQRGYETAMLGKWHLGDKEGHLPNDNGFDTFYGALHSNDMKPYEIYRNNKVEIEAPVDQTILTKNFTKDFTKEAVNFITENKDEPFFLYYAQPFPHEPLNASEDFEGTSETGLYGDVVEEVDWSVGEILKTLEKQGLDDNTIIIFTSDNGPWHEGSPGDGRGRKGNNYDGGQKVTLIAWWSGTLPEAEIIDEMSMGIDVFSTILDIVGVPLPEDRIIDGKNILPLLKGEQAESPHEELYFIKSKKVKAVRTKDWKYHIKNTSDNSTYWMMKVGPFLFDINKDSNESYNLTEHEPEVVAELNGKIEKMQASFKENLRGWR